MQSATRDISKPPETAMTIRLPEPLYRRLREMAYRTDAKMHPFILRAVAALLDAEGY